MIPNVGSVHLSGPLSRNDQIRDLKPGDRVEVRVLKWTGPDAARIDLKGNIVSARFNTPVPHTDKLQLEMKSIRGYTLQFELKTDSSGNITAGSIAQELLVGKNPLSADMLRSVLLSIRQGMVSPFQLSLAVMNNRPSDRSGDIRRMIDLLLEKGMSKESVFIASALLSGVSEEAIPDLLRGFAAIVSGKEQPLVESGSFQAVDSQPGQLPDNPAWHGLLLWPEGENRYEIECAADGHRFAGRCELPALGNIEFIVRSGSHLEAVIHCEERSLDQVSSRAVELLDRLKIRYPDPSLHILTGFQWREKVLAFAETIGNSSFDVTA
jgi:hypothetical protein